MEAGCCVVLALVFARIHASDVRGRVVFAGDLGALCAVRLGFLMLVVLGAFPADSFGARCWGCEGLVRSIVVGAAVSATVALAGWAVSRITGREALGRGDVMLYAACCLFLDLRGAVLFLAISSVVGAVQACAAGLRHTSTFPFAPALVWSCLAALVMRVAAFAL